MITINKYLKQLVEQLVAFRLYLFCEFGFNTFNQFVEVETLLFAFIFVGSNDFATTFPSNKFFKCNLKRNLHNYEMVCPLEVST